LSIANSASLSSRRFLCDALLPIFHATPDVSGRADDPATRELAQQLSILSRLCSEDRLWQEVVIPSTIVLPIDRPCLYSSYRGLLIIHLSYIVCETSSSIIGIQRLYNWSQLCPS
jgi:hypothetical protein